MNKKNITIDTDFYNSDIDNNIIKVIQPHVTQTIHASDNVQYHYSNNEHQPSTNYNQQTFNQTIKSDGNEYSFEHTQQQYQHTVNSNLQGSGQQQESYHQEALQNDQSQMLNEQERKIDAANLFENILSRAMAGLFIRCWEELKGVLTQTNQSHSVSEDYQNHYQQQPQRQPESTISRENMFSKYAVHQNSINSNTYNSKHLQSTLSSDERKRQILQRQRNGITLDSLEKQQIQSGLHHSKSQSKLVTKDELQQNKRNYEGHQRQSSPPEYQNNFYEGRNGSHVSSKSYREKFMEYKHRSKSRQNLNHRYAQNYHLNSYHLGNNNPTIMRGATATTNHQQFNRSHSRSHSNLKGRNYNYETNQHFRSTNHLDSLRHRSHYNNSRNDLLNNISDLLNQRQNITFDKGDHMYQFTGGSNGLHYHHNSQRNFYLNDMTNSQLHQMHEQQQIERARLLEEIVEKLNYTKFRVAEGNRGDNYPEQEQDLQMVRKLARLEKLVLDLKSGDGDQSVYQKQNITLTAQQKQQAEMYKKLSNELQSIRSEINSLKYTQLGSGQSQIISQQRNLLNNYQKEYERLLSSKNTAITSATTTTLNENKYAFGGGKPQAQNHNNRIQGAGFLQGLMAASKDAKKNVSWSQGWGQITTAVKQQPSTKNGHYDDLQRIDETITIDINDQTRERHQRLKKFQGADHYRYTRNQILESIGRKEQVEEQARLARETQTRMTIDKEKQEEEFRRMTENVKVQRQKQLEEQEIKKNRPIREIYEQEWERYQKSRIDVDLEGTDRRGCCGGLFPC